MALDQDHLDWIATEIAMRPKLGPERLRRVIEILAEAYPA